MTANSPRKLSVFAFDPFVANKTSNRRIRSLLISLPAEMDGIDIGENCDWGGQDSFCGPIGEYLEVIDYDPSSKAFYQPINFNDPHVLLNNGLEPSEEDPRFHQQMVYAVAMNTIATFEQALGRVALWSPRDWKKENTREQNRAENRYVRRLRIYPHALREANAYYDPTKKALLFGYFQAGPENRNLLPGSTIFTCLSQDIIVHETCHALLDGLHPQFAESSNADVLAFHEAFSDIVAIFQHFSYPEVLEDQISKTNGDLEQQSLLGALAQEFGQALGRGSALRDALGRMNNGVWEPLAPDNRRLEQVEHPHERGAVLVAAVFRAFLTIYKQRIADLIRIASNGSGILRAGALDPDLTKRLAGEAAKSARHILQICVRALDYCPPVDLSFGDYLRALITADTDLFPDDPVGYRPAIIEAFVAWGIVPEGMPIVTQRTLLWPTLSAAAKERDLKHGPIESNLGQLLSNASDSFDDIRNVGLLQGEAGEKVILSLDRKAEVITETMNQNMEALLRSKKFDRTPGRLFKENILARNLLDMDLSANREVLYLTQEFYAQLFWAIIVSKDDPDLHRILGVTLSEGAPKSIWRSKMNNLPKVHVNSVRMAKRIGARGQFEREYVVELIQSRNAYFDKDKQALADAGKLEDGEEADFRFRSGCTLLIDAKTFVIRRVIRTRITCDSDADLERQRKFRLGRETHPANAFDGVTQEGDGQAFACLHRDVDHGQSGRDF